jgi:hypothetical protein
MTTVKGFATAHAHARLIRFQPLRARVHAHNDHERGGDKLNIKAHHS